MLIWSQNPLCRIPYGLYSFPRRFFNRVYITCIYYNTKEWIVFFVRSDWPLKSIALFYVSRAIFYPNLFRNKVTVLAGYSLLWYIVNQLFT